MRSVFSAFTFVTLGLATGLATMPLHALAQPAVEAPVAPDGDAKANAALGSLRRALAAVNDPESAVTRLETFQTTFAGTQAARDADADLATWRERLTRGLVHVGDEWLTPEERDQRVAGSNEAAGEARRLLRQGLIDESAKEVEAVLRVDPANVTALYVLGLIGIERNRLAEARVAFTKVVEQLPSHGPSLANLAVIASRTNQPIPAAAQYEKALDAMGGERMLLDNIAEYLHAAPDAAARSAVARRLKLKFDVEDQKLAAKLAAQGLQRWGATYITTAQRDALTRQEVELRARIDAIARSDGLARGRVASAERELDATDREMRRLDSQSYVRNNDGSFTRVPLPPLYYQLQADLGRLQQERAVALREVENLRLSLQQLQAAMPSPTYTGQQRTYGTSGTPLKLQPPTGR